MKSSAARRGLHLGWQPYRGRVAGIVHAAIVHRAGPRRAAANDRILCRNPGRRPGLSLETLVRAAENRPRRSRVLAALGFACALALLVAAAWPGAADSAPARVVVLGKTDATPPPSCPGKIVNNVEVIPCRVEGHVTGFQAIAGGVAAPLRGSLRRQDRRLVDHARAPVAHGQRQDHRRGRLLQRIPRQALAGADRRPAPGRRLEAAPVHAGPPEPAADPQPLLRQHPDLRPRPPAHRPAGPGRRPHDPDLGADVRLQRRRRQHLARQPPARALLLEGRHPGRPPPAGRRQDQDLRLLLLATPACSTRRRSSRPPDRRIPASSVARVQSTPRSLRPWTAWSGSLDECRLARPQYGQSLTSSRSAGRSGGRRGGSPACAGGRRRRGRAAGPSPPAPSPRRSRDRRRPEPGSAWASASRPEAGARIR